MLAYRKSESSSRSRQRHARGEDGNNVTGWYGSVMKIARWRSAAAAPAMA